ncbi:MAG: OsmC family protein [Roseiflexaceae bacterium]
MNNSITICVVADVTTQPVQLPQLPDVAQHPMQGLIYLLAHCTILTFNGICRRQRAMIHRYACTITARQRRMHPQIYEEVSVQMRVVGVGLQYDRLLHGFHLIPKYCPVHATLAATCPIRHHLLIDLETSP